MPEASGLRFPIPLDLMAVPTANGRTEFLGAHFLVAASLPVQDYAPSDSCVSHWVMLLPPAGLDERNTMSQARTPFQGWINIFKQWKDGATVMEGELDTFGQWLHDSGATPVSSVVVTLSHHAENRLCFTDAACAGPSIPSVSVKRTVSSPSIAIINACGTADPGAYEFIRELNDRGVSAAVATTISVDADMAGRFLEGLVTHLFRHANDTSYTLSRAKFDAIQQLRVDPKYGDSALIYSLLGNGALRVCVPPQAPPEL